MNKIYTCEDYVGDSEIIHLHNHSIASMLDGVAYVQQYASESKKRGYRALALTEHGHMASVPDGFFECKKSGLKYIAGSEIYLNDHEPIRQELESKGIKWRSEEWKKQNIEDYFKITRNRHLTVLCKNRQGVENLIKLTTEAYKDGLFGMGRAKYNRSWTEKLFKYKEGLIVLSGCLNGPVSHELRTKQIKDREGNILKERTDSECLNSAVNIIKSYKQIFGDDYYIELQMPGVDGDDRVFKILNMIADKFKIKPVITNDCHYMKREDSMIQKIMMAIDQETTVDSPDLFHVNSDEQYFKTRAELWTRFKNNTYSDGIDDRRFHEACDNSIEIADKCDNVKFDLSPKIPSIEDADKKLITIVKNRLKELGLDKCDRKFVVDGKEVTYLDQAKLELSRFIEKGFASYFLITKDLIDYGKNRGFPFAPRGCTTPDALVNVSVNSCQKISDISIGDEIIDGFGDKQVVENKFIYDVSEELFVIEVDGCVLELTSDHKLYVIRDNIVCLLKAYEIKDTDEIIGGISDLIANVEKNQNNI